VNDAGAVAFQSATFTGDSVYVGDPGGLESVASIGDPTPDGGVLTRFLEDASSINAAGDVAFTAVNSPDDLTYSGFGLYLSSPGGAGGGRTLTLLAHHGDAAPGGNTFEYIVSPEIADDGSVTFLARLQEGDAAFGIYTYRAGEISLLARTGGTAPDGTAFLSLGLPAVSQDGAAYAFEAAYGGPTARANGIFLGNTAGGPVRRVAGIGDALLGSRITRIGFANDGMSSPKYLGFDYELADGRAGVGVAVSSAPEPGSGWLAVAAAPLAALPLRRALRSLRLRP
jgi:hypothetical protein